MLINKLKKVLCVGSPPAQIQPTRISMTKKEKIDSIHSACDVLCSLQIAPSLASIVQFVFLSAAIQTSLFKQSFTCKKGGGVCLTTQVKVCEGSLTNTTFMINKGRLHTLAILLINFFFLF